MSKKKPKKPRANPKRKSGARKKRRGRRNWDTPAITPVPA